MNLEQALLIKGFSPVQAEVLYLMSYGLSNSEIALRLGISAKAVGKRVQTIYEKTFFTKREQLIAYYGTLRLARYPEETILPRGRVA